MTRVYGQPHPDVAGRFEIGSVTKTFTALVLAWLEGQGELDANERLLDVLPTRGRLRDAAVRRIQLRDLASHTAGLPRLPPQFWPRALLRADNPYARTEPGDLVRWLRRTRLRSAPGDAYLYSNFGYALLGQALSNRTGLAFSTLVERNVCGPLQLASVSTATREGDLHGYSGSGDVQAHWQLDAFEPAGGLRAAVGDIVTFLEAQLVPPPGSLGAAIQATHHIRSRLGTDMGVSLGWHWGRLMRSGVEFGWANGATGGFAVMAAFSCRSQVAVAAAVNCNVSLDPLVVRLLDDLAVTEEPRG